MAYCDYYYYTSSFLSVRGYCKKKEELGERDSSVSSAEERRYCEGYTSYKDCPIYNSSGSGYACWITQAVCNYKELGDKCGLMMSIRSFRDSILGSTEEGRNMIEKYYETAPEIVTSISEFSEEKRKQVYERIFNAFIMPCTEHIKANRYREAISLFNSTMNGLIAEFG